MFNGTMAIAGISFCDLLRQEIEQDRKEQGNREGELEPDAVEHNMQLGLDIIFIQDLEH